MGIYTSNRYFGEAYDYASEIPANEAYGAAIGCAQVLADCQTNDMALFESTIYSDIAEVRAVQEGVGYVNENAFTDVIKKIVEMFKKLLAKIKGIFKSFIAKLTGAFKNGKDLVKKYEKQIIKYSNWKGFKCKGIRIPKQDNVKTTIDNLFKANTTGAVGYDIGLSDLGTMQKNNDLLLNTKVPGFERAKAIKDADSEDLKEAILKLYLNGKATSWDSIHEDIMDEIFNDEETLDGDDQVTSASFFSSTWIKVILADDKWEKDVKKFNDKIEKNINIIIDNLNKDDDKLAKFMLNKDNKGKGVAFKHGNNVSIDRRYNASSSDNKVDKNSDDEYTAGTYRYNIRGAAAPFDLDLDPKKVQESIHALQKLASNEQEVIVKVTSEYMTVVKFSLAQARKVWTAAAAYSSGVHKESVEYVQAVGESAAEQFYTNMEAIC